LIAGNFFCGGQLELFYFSQFPKAWLVDLQFQSGLVKAEVLYGILLDRRMCSQLKMDERMQMGGKCSSKIVEVIEVLSCGNNRMISLLLQQMLEKR